MKTLFIVGNWKSNKTVNEAKEWRSQFPGSPSPDIMVVLCVPFTLLNVMKDGPYKLGAQNISPFDNGAYTGEVSARMVKDLADWVIIGHSERRKYFGETDEILAQKVKLAHSAGLKIIYCVPDTKTVIPQGVEVVAYEPVWAIGTGKAESPENANTVIGMIKAATQVKTVLYGGSVTPENVASFTSQPNIDGVLPGGASLTPESFYSLIQNAQ